MTDTATARGPRRIGGSDGRGPGRERPIRTLVRALLVGICALGMSGLLAACASDSSRGDAGTAADQHAIDSTNRDFNKPIIDVQREAWRRCAPWRRKIEKVNADLNDGAAEGADIVDWTFDCTGSSPVLSVTVPSPNAIPQADREVMTSAVADSVPWMQVAFIDSSGDPLPAPQ
jgi:hypothetical protein